MKPYNRVFIGVLFVVILLALLSAARPYILQQAIDKNIATKTLEGFLPYILLMATLLLFEVISQLLFIFYASWLGQTVVKDIRVTLFNHMLC
ncbi:ABC transporter transmembrane domain-containing protein, partial [Bizionia echini]|uniref:ABC transporter transmembrane domain-containing protein n=1 Tax=Bizionia echini TaxID=649333 RepID=UPI0030DA8841